jgi:hypothetical protein
VELSKFVRHHSDSCNGRCTYLLINRKSVMWVAGDGARDDPHNPGGFQRAVG